MAKTKEDRMALVKQYSAIVMLLFFIVFNSIFTKNFFQISNLNNIITQICPTILCGMGIDMAKELAELEAVQEAAAKAAQAPAEDPLPEPLPPVDFDTFCKVEMTVVKVKACEKVKKSNKLLKFTLDDGTGTDRQILSGIAQYYEPEQLVGKTLVAVTNLPPRKMMGQDSCGMILSAERGDKLQVVMLDDSVPAGARLV